MRCLKLISIQLFFLAMPLLSHAQKENSNQVAEKFILKVMREYKNPMAYYPLRKDIFLPSEEEQAKTDLKHSYPKGAVIMGSFIFLKAGTDYQREPFVDAFGNRMFDNFLHPERKPLSLRGDVSFFQKKQRRLLDGNPNIGKFLLFNELFIGN